MALDLKVLQDGNMTQTQLQIWVAQILSGRRPIYNMGMAIEIDSDLDVELFRQAFDYVVAKSDNLRSVFCYVDGGPKRVVLSPDEIEYDIPVKDFTNEPEQAAEWMQECMRQRFKLNERLFSSALLKTGAESFTWFICQHHLICDGWSFSNFTSWVGDRYLQLESGDQSDRDIPDFGNFVDDELRYYESEQCQLSSTYWDNIASNPLPELSLYGQNVENANSATERVHRQLSGDFIGCMKHAIANRQFRAFSEDQGMYLLMLTAMLLTLKRASGNDEFSLAVCLHNRITPQDKVSLGPFFIHSAVRVALQPGDSFSDLYARVAKEYRQMLRHYRHPVSAPPGERVWDATVNYVNKTFPEFATRPTKIHWLRSGACSPEELVGLQIHRFNKGDGMEAEWDFNSGIFSDSKHQQSAAVDFEQAIEFGLSSPNAPLSDFIQLRQSGH